MAVSSVPWVSTLWSSRARAWSTVARLILNDASAPIRSARFRPSSSWTSSAPSSTLSLASKNVSFTMPLAWTASRFPFGSRHTDGRNPRSPCPCFGDCRRNDLGRWLHGREDLIDHLLADEVEPDQACANHDGRQQRQPDKNAPFHGVSAFIAAQPQARTKRIGPPRIQPSASRQRSPLTRSMLQCHMPRSPKNEWLLWLQPCLRRPRYGSPPRSGSGVPLAHSRCLVESQQGYPMLAG